MNDFSAPSVSPAGPITQTGNPFFAIQLLGFSPRERTLFMSVFNLSRGRARHYVEFDPKQHAKIDFFIVDSNDEEAIDCFYSIPADTYSNALFVDESPRNRSFASISRPIRWAELLLHLDSGMTLDSALIQERPSKTAAAPAEVKAVAPPIAKPIAPIVAQPTAPITAQPTTPTDTQPEQSTRSTQIIRAEVNAKIENEFEISTIGNWYPREQATSFSTDPAVLVVDPDLAARRYMAAKFIDLKYQVDYAESGEQALEMVQTQRYNAIFMETALPGADGYEITKLIKSRPDRRRIAIVFITSRNSTVDRVKGAMAGCDAYLTKPIDQDKLVVVLDKFLPNWRTQLPLV